uniref:small integral membrane protein 34A n=1 Tax=Jaculus jaculus TaxID=51337 RepID=UPI001E1B4B89|nr:small integral membrane protein 34A [Jaculus jaculus]XP_045006592.1 small integral membrane protein 34A [Jaculus jaculus]
MEVTMWTPQGAFNQTQSKSLLSGSLQGRSSPNSSRSLTLSDGTSAAWYILTIIGFYGVIFLLRLASNILQKNDKSSEDIYYSNLTSELQRKGVQSKAAKCASPVITNTADLQPYQASMGSKCENNTPHMGTQLSP